MIHASIVPRQVSQYRQTCFVNFNLTAEHVKDIALHGEPDFVKHEPCALLSDADVAVDLIRRNAALAIGDHPYSKKPFVQADWRVFKDSTDLDGELPLRVLRLASVARQGTAARQVAGRESLSSQTF